MISKLVAINDAPKTTSQPLYRQIKSTRWPTGIFKAQGIIAQKPNAARNSAERPR